MRADQRAPRRGVAAALVAQQRAIAVFGVERRRSGRQRLDLALQRQLGPGERRGVVAIARDHRLEAVDAFEPRRGDGDAEFGRLALERVEPGRVARALLEQPVAAAQRALELATRAPWWGSIASTSRSRKRRRSLAGPANRPSIAGVSQTRRRWSAKARAEATGARSMRFSRSGAPRVARVETDAELAGAPLVLDLDRDREAARPADARASGELGAAQAAARREQRQRLEQIGLAGAVLAAKDDQRALEREVERRVGAEVAEHQPAHHRASAREGRIGRARHRRGDVPRPRRGAKGEGAACRPARPAACVVAANEFRRDASGGDVRSSDARRGHGGNRRAAGKARRRCIGCGEAPGPRGERSTRSRRACAPSSRPGRAPVDAALMRRLPKLEIVASFGVGYDHIDAGWAGAHGIVVTHTPGVLDEEVADIAHGADARRDAPAAAGGALSARGPLAEGGRFRSPPRCAAARWAFSGSGRIGKQIARRAEAFGLDVVYHGRQAAGRRALSLLSHARSAWPRPATS